MTETLRAAIEATAAELRDVADPVERHQATRREREFLLREGDAALRVIEQEIALELRAEGTEDQRPWPEVGRLMGGISRQRAQQISQGE